MTSSWRNVLEDENDRNAVGCSYEARTGVLHSGFLKEEEDVNIALSKDDEKADQMIDGKTDGKTDDGECSEDCTRGVVWPEPLPAAPGHR